jgi:hypothetical protein
MTCNVISPDDACRKWNGNGKDAVIEDRRIPGFGVARAFAIAAMILVNFDVIMEARAGPMPWTAAVVEFLYGRAAATFVMLAGVSLSLMAGRRRSSVTAQPLGSYKMNDGYMACALFMSYIRVAAKNNCTILLDLWPICGVAWKATYLDMQPSMRLADEPNPGATWHNYFLPRP